MESDAQPRSEAAAAKRDDEAAAAKRDDHDDREDDREDREDRDECDERGGRDLSWGEGIMQRLGLQAIARRRWLPCSHFPPR